ncbi:PD-(D/E)XK motif protein [Labedella populi]|nr:PD-(D/E)XK motif protein [Labedella populi]
MIASAVKGVFQDLQARAAGEAGGSDVGYFVEEQLNSSLRMFLGVSNEGKLALILVPKKSNVPPAPVRLASLSVDFGRQCGLISVSGTEMLRVTVIQCTSTESAQADVFASMCSSMLQSLAGSTTERDVASNIDAWAALFWQLQQRVDTDVVGICGELMVIAASGDPKSWVSAWHSNPNDVIDFEFQTPSLSVEVKAARSAKRLHTLSLMQSLGTGAHSQLLASVPVTFSQSGRTVASLVREVVDRLDGAALQLKLWDVLGATCGNSLDDVLARTVDVDAGIAGVRIFSMRDVPSPTIQEPLPPQVVRIQFSVDLTDIHGMSLSEFEAPYGFGPGQLGAPT